MLREIFLRVADASQLDARDQTPLFGTRSSEKMAKKCRFSPSLGSYGQTNMLNDELSLKARHLACLFGRSCQGKVKND